MIGNSGSTTAPTLGTAAGTTLKPEVLDPNARVVYGSRVKTGSAFCHARLGNPVAY